MFSLSLRRASAVLIAAFLLVAAFAIVAASHAGTTTGASPRWNGGMVTVKHAPVKPPVAHTNSPRWN
jgi:hypothetical protein